MTHTFIEITLHVEHDEYQRWVGWYQKTQDWHHQTFAAWLVTLIGAKARESNEAWDAKHACQEHQLCSLVNGKHVKGTLPKGWVA